MQKLNNRPDSKLSGPVSSPSSSCLIIAGLLNSSSVNSGGSLASICEGTTAPPCEPTVNKPLLINMPRGRVIHAGHAPTGLLLDITQPPPGGRLTALSSCGVAGPRVGLRDVVKGGKTGQ